MADYAYLEVSDGTQDAALMHITADRTAGASIIDVDSVVGVPAKFIGTYGSQLASGLIDISTKVDFKGHLGTGNLVIDGIEPGSTDIGNTEGQIVIIKPNSVWANLVATAILASFARGVVENTSVTAPAPDVDLTTQYNLTAQAAAAAFAVPTGTPEDGQPLIIRIKDNGTARALTWASIYRPLGVALPTTTIISKTLYCGFVFNSADTKWDLVALAQEA